MNPNHDIPARCFRFEAGELRIEPTVRNSGIGVRLSVPFPDGTEMALEPIFSDPDAATRYIEEIDTERAWHLYQEISRLPAMI